MRKYNEREKNSQKLSLFAADARIIWMYQLICGWDFVQIFHSFELLVSMIEYVTDVFVDENSDFITRWMFIVNFTYNLVIIFSWFIRHPQHYNSLNRRLTTIIRNYFKKINKNNI